MVCFYMWPFTWQFRFTHVPRCGQVGRKEREKKNLRVRRQSCPGFQNHPVQAGSVTSVVRALPGGGALHLARSLQNASGRPSRRVPGSEVQKGIDKKGPHAYHR